MKPGGRRAGAGERQSMDVHSCRWDRKSSRRVNLSLTMLMLSSEPFTPSMRHAHGTGFGATHSSAGVRNLERGWATPRGFRAALACSGARGSRCLCWADGPSTAKVYSAQIGSSRETRFVANSQDSVISLRAVAPSAFRGSMKPGGRRTREVEHHNTGFSTPSNARGRRSLGRQAPTTRGGLDLFGTHTQLAQSPPRI
jgi:hypothetical protein